MIDEQLEAYPGHESFVLAVLGLHSICGDFVSALQIERRDGAACAEGPYVDFALGVVSLARTLQAMLSTLPLSPAEAAAPQIPGPAGTPRWLR